MKIHIVVESNVGTIDSDSLDSLREKVGVSAEQVLDNPVRVLCVEVKS